MFGKLAVLLLVLQCIRSSASLQVGANSTSQARLTILAPKYIRPLSDFHVLVSLSNSPSPATVDLQLTGARDSDREQNESKSILVESGETQTLKFPIGDWPAAEYTLSASAVAVDRSWNFSQEATLGFKAKSYSAFIQTDKAVYKAGETVNFRAIFLSQTLAPMSLSGEINVTVSDPKRNIVKQWTRLSNYRGLVTLELPLSDDPMLGDWSILVEARQQSSSKKFQVAEYVLPTFDVAIRLPSYVTYNESELVATVAATYTYGKPVSGHVTLTVQPLVRFSHISTRPLESSQFRARLENGQADLQVDLMKDLRLRADLFEREIEFFALVEEDLTGRKYNRSKIMRVYEDNIKIKRISPGTFKPGLDYLLQLKVAYQDDTPVEDNGPELELNLSWKGNELEKVKLRPRAGLVERLIKTPRDLLETNTMRYIVSKSIDINTNYRGQSRFISSIAAQQSRSAEHLKISFPQLESHKSKGAAVDDQLQIRVESTEVMSTGQQQPVVCQGTSRGNIVWALSREPTNLTEFQFDIKLDQRMTPVLKVLCYYVRPQNNELIADSVDVQVGGLVRNSIKVSASREEAKPGQEVELTVKTKPNSFVGLLGVDQSVLLLKTGNDITNKEVVEEMKSYGSSGKDEERSNTQSLIEESELVVLTNTYVHRDQAFELGRYYAMSYLAPVAYMKTAPKSGISLDTLLLESTLNPPEFHLPDSAGGQATVIRSFFPETWLWQNATANDSGQLQLKTKMPDTITSWSVSAFSLSEAHGFGLSEPQALVRVFRPFFVRLQLPYSIMRGETLVVQAIVFNYSKRPTQAKVSLENRNQEFDFVEPSNSVEDEQRKSSESESRTVRVPANDGVSVSFLITPKKLGYIDMRVVAQSEFASDGLVQKLLVKPEGQTQYINKAMLINLDASTSGGSSVSKNISIEVPTNAVPGSQRVQVNAVGDILGPGLSNVDDLLRLPYGCGEQNMINLVPNLVILNYLQQTNRIRGNQKSRAIRNIETGYQRQLNYKRADGSFSAFGPSDTNGSVWLTAYVLKTFQQASKVIGIDESVIKQAASFIARHSRPDGTIEEVGMLHNKRLQSAGGENPIYLTAYSMIALLQRPISNESEPVEAESIEKVLERGLGYLESQLESAEVQQDPYNLAIISYTLDLAKRQQSADRAFDMLMAQAHEDRGLMWWMPKVAAEGQAGADAKLRASSEGEREGDFRPETDRDPAPSSSTVQPPLKPLPVNNKQSAHLFVPDSLAIEASSLALLTLVRRNDLDRALPIVGWLISQQNSNGGFSSTQDTVLAIEALATFAAASSAARQPPSIDLELVYPRAQSTSNSVLRRNNVDQLLLSSSNALVNQQVRLPDNTSWVKITATGRGAGVVQVAWQYNLLVSAERAAFYLNPTIDKTSNVNYLQLSVCTYYKAGEKSNMALMEVELPSGYVADAEALPGLKRQRDIMRVDTSDGDTKVLIYISQVTRDELCLTIPAHRTTKVSNNRPVPVTIYDYYDRQRTARIFYEPKASATCDICDRSEPECSRICSSKPKRSDRLVSLHEQRRLQSRLLPANNQTKADLMAKNDAPPGAQDTIGAQQILPLAPVFMSIVSVAKDLYGVSNNSATTQRVIR